MSEIITQANELIELWPDIDRAERLHAFRSLPRDQADDFFLELGARNQLDLIRSLPARERRIWLRLLAPDDTADLVQLASPEERPELLAQLDEIARREVNALLAYKDDVAGGLMSPRFVRLRPDMTVDEAISYLRRQAGRSKPSTTRTRSMTTNGCAAWSASAAFYRRIAPRPFATSCGRSSSLPPTTLTRRRSRNSSHNITCLPYPCWMQQGRMEGIVTVDDIVDVVQEEASEDIQKIGGLEALDAPYLKIGFWRMVRKRAGWLAILFLGEMLTATAMGHFEHEIARAVVLALFVPLIISSGGNSGSQATTLVIRAMAVREIRLRDWWRVIQRELSAGLVLGTALAAIGLARILVWQAHMATVR